MKEQLKKTVSTVKSNIVGTLVGGVAGYYTAKKAIKTEKKWVLAVSILVGAVAGAMVQSKIGAKASTPTATTVVKK